MLTFKILIICLSRFEIHFVKVSYSKNFFLKNAENLSKKKKKKQ